MDDLQRDGMPMPPECPAWATCGTCGSCVQRDPFSYVANPVLRTTLERTCGLCEQAGEEPTVVALDSAPREMPCSGEGWWPR